MNVFTEQILTVVISSDGKADSENEYIITLDTR